MMIPFSFSRQVQWLKTEAPRYTSYPSALYFKPLHPETHQQWLDDFDYNQSIALYIHVPFCKQLCWFCGCHTKIATNVSPITAYAQTLVKEIALIGSNAPHKMKLHSVHFGGGSPSILSNADMENIFSKIHAIFDVQQDAEIAIEIDPRHINKEKIQQYKHLCFNRVSLGIQDTNEAVQVAINRIQPFNQVRQCCDMLRDEGIHAINMDLIYGLPLQSMRSMEQTIKQVSSLTPSRLAYYSFSHLPGIKKHQRLIIETDLPSIEEKGRIYLHSSKIFEEHGYKPLGIDHFSKKDDCFMGFYEKTFRRNFMGYTEQPNDYVLGIGSSALSNLGKGISQNSVKDIDYKKAIDQGGWASVRGWSFSPEDLMRGAIINELMCYFSVDLTIILEQFNYPVDYFDKHLELLSDFINTGVISINNRHINFHSPLRMIVRSVCAVFDQYHLTLESGKYLKIS